MEYCITSETIGNGFDSVQGGENKEYDTLGEAQSYQDSLNPLEEWCKRACNMVNTNYQEFCLLGLVCGANIVNNTLKTRDEIDKKINNVTLDLDTGYDWTMDEPREKVVFTSKEQFLAFIEFVQTTIASNETKLRDKKTELTNCTMIEVQAFIDNPVYPIYDRTV